MDPIGSRTHFFQKWMAKKTHPTSFSIRWTYFKENKGGPLFLDHISQLSGIFARYRYVAAAKECCLVLASHHPMRMDLDVCPSNLIATGTTQSSWPGTTRVDSIRMFLWLEFRHSALRKVFREQTGFRYVYTYTHVFIYIYIIYIYEFLKTHIDMIDIFHCSHTHAVQGQLWFGRITWGSRLKSNKVNFECCWACRSYCNPWMRSRQVMIHLFRKAVCRSPVNARCIFFSHQMSNLWGFFEQVAGGRAFLGSGRTGAMNGSVWESRILSWLEIKLRSLTKPT